MNLKKKLKSLIPPKYIYKVLHLKKTIPFIGDAAQNSFSGNGEDIILLNYLFKDKKNGFYIDIGSFHPKIISNTHKLYKLGWHGINVDPNPQAIELFKKSRKRDVNLQIGISQNHEKKTYYNFSYSGANTFDEKFAKEKMNKDWNTLISKEEIDCLPLSSIIEQNIKVDKQEIDLLDIDVEGLDLQVLKSNNWDKFRPSVILVEDKEFRKKPGDSDVYTYLIDKGYKFHSYLDITLVMTEKDFKPNS